MARIFSKSIMMVANGFSKESMNEVDLRHKSTLEGLLLPWMIAQIATTALDHAQFSGGSRPQVRTDEVRKLSEEGRLKEALHLTKHMVGERSEAPIAAYVWLLKACARKKALAEGKQVHALMIESNCDSNIFLTNHLLNMYSKCGSVWDAHEVFNQMPQHNIFSWTAIISAYVDSGQCEEAIHLFQQMQGTGIEPDKVAFVVVLKACTRTAALEQGKQLHLEISKRYFATDLTVQSTLVDFYAKCGCLEDARQLFTNMIKRDVVSWNAMIQGYVENGFGKEGLALYEQMKLEGVQPGKVTCIVVLRACASIGALEEGKHIHLYIRTRGFESDVTVQNTLIDMYAKCACLEDALQLFNNMRERNVVSWSAMIQAYVQSGLGKEALALYEQMKQENVHPNKVTFVVLLKACASIASLEKGKQLHSLIVSRGLGSDLIIQNALVDMYVKCGCLDNARELFSCMRERDVVSWNAMIQGYLHNGLGKEALDLYEQMKKDGVQPSKVTFVVILKACASIAAIEQGRQLHLLLIKRGFGSELIIQNTLIDMYSTFGCLDDARKLFNSMKVRDVVSWSSMIQGYAQKGLGKEVLALYEQMTQAGLQPDKVIYVVVLKACARIAALGEGKQLHLEIRKRGFESDVTIQQTLIDMYASCRCLDAAREVFSCMRKRNVVSWTAMIQGYAKNGLSEEAFALYEQMKHEGVQPDRVIFAVALKACASIAALENGKRLHSEIKQRGFDSDVIVQSALVDLYAKCGCLDNARELFNNMKERSVVSWNAMIQAYVQAGLGKESLFLYEKMIQEGVQPDEVTYICALSACSHSGLVNEGHLIFDSLCQNPSVSPTMDHYACMVDILGRAGCLSIAEEFIMRMPIRPDIVVWMSLLGAARNYHDVEIGRRSFDCVVKLNPEHAAAYVLLLDIYTAAGMTDELAKVRKQMKDKAVISEQSDVMCRE